MYIYASIIHIHDRERIKLRFQVNCKSVEWDPFEICSDLSLAFAVLSHAWRFPPGHFWIFILCGYTGHFVFKWTAVKKKNEYNNLLELSRRERKDSSGAFWSMSFLHLGPERRGASVDTFPRNQKDGLELASFHYKSWTVHQQSCSESRSLIFPCTLWFQGRTMFRPYERVPIMPQKNPIIKWRARFQLVKFHLGVTKNKKTTTEQKLNVST